MLTVPDSSQMENVYDLTLTFDDGTVRTAKLGLIQGLSPDSEGASHTMEIPVSDDNVFRNDVWTMTHRCFHDLWREDPERAYIHLLKTRFHLSSDEVRDFLDVSSSANVDQIFSRSVKFLRSAWVRHEKGGI